MMMTKSKLAFASAAVLAIFTAPALAQAVDHTGTLQPAYYGTDGKQVVGSPAPSGNSVSTGRAANNPITPVVQTRRLYNSAKRPSDR
jgi:hypothetical protein